MGSCLVGGWASNAKRLLNHRNGDQKMNQAERQALRKKHHVGNNEGDDQCQSCYSADGYPCDVIKVLDAWDFERAMQKIEDINVELGLPE